MLRLRHELFSHAATPTEKNLSTAALVHATHVNAVAYSRDMTRNALPVPPRADSRRRHFLAASFNPFNVSTQFVWFHRFSFIIHTAIDC